MRYPKPRREDPSLSRFTQLRLTPTEKDPVAAVCMAWEIPGKPSLISKGQQHPRHLFNRHPDGCCLCSGPLSAAAKTYRAQTLKEAHRVGIKRTGGLKGPCPSPWEFPFFHVHPRGTFRPDGPGLLVNWPYRLGHPKGEAGAMLVCASGHFEYHPSG